MQVLRSSARRVAAATGALATTLLIAAACLGAGDAAALGIGESGFYDFAGAGCDPEDHTDPVTVLFRGKRGYAGAVSDEIIKHAGWDDGGISDHYLWVLTAGGDYECRQNNVQRADHAEENLSGRFHVRLWFIPASGSALYKTVGTPHHEDWIWKFEHSGCDFEGFGGSHAVDQNGPEGSGFDQGREELSAQFWEDGHRVVHENWGNTSSFHQCDGGWAGSNGIGNVIGIGKMEPPRANSSTARATSSTLKGTMFPEETATDYWFAYGTKSAEGSGYPNKTTVKSKSGGGTVDVSEAISGLSPNTGYYMRLFARNQEGEVEESTEFQYSTTPPSDTTANVTRVLHGQPGWAWVSGWVKDSPNGTGLDNVTVNVNFVRNGETVKSVHPVVHNGYYETGYVPLGKGSWSTRTVFPDQEGFGESASGYHEFNVRDGVQIVAKHSGNCMDVFNVSTANTAPIMHGQCLNPVTSQNQVFTLVPNGSYFQLVARHSGRCVDVTSASTADGAGIQQYDCLGAGQANQLFQEAWNGSYASYVAKHSGKCLDVTGANLGWTNFQQWSCNGGAQQYFRLEPVESGPIPTQTYLTVDQALHGSPGLVSFHGNLQAGAYGMANRVVHVEFDNADTPTWDTSGGDVALSVNGSGSYEYRDFALSPGRWNVRARFVGNSEFGESTTGATNFTIKRGYQVVSRYSGKCLSLSEAKNQNGQAFLQWTCSGAPASGDGQVMSFWPRGNGWYDLRVNGTNRCVDVTGVSTADGAYLQLWDCLGANQFNQHWDREPIAGQAGWYALIARHSNKCMDALGPSLNNGTRIGQWSCHWGGNQQWELRGVINP